MLLGEGERLVSSIEHLEFDEVSSQTERLRSFINSHVDLVAGHRKTARILVDAGLVDLTPSRRKKSIGIRDTYDRILRGIVRAGIDAGEFAEVDEKFVGFAIASMIVRTRIWFSSEGRYSSDELANFIFNSVMNGIKAHRK